MYDFVDFKPRKKGLGKVLGTSRRRSWMRCGSQLPVPCVTSTKASASKRKIAYTTVMTIMSRLAKKGLLIKEKEGPAFQYRPAVSREEFRTIVASEVISGLLDGFGKEAFSRLIEETAKADPRGHRRAGTFHRGTKKAESRSAACRSPHCTDTLSSPTRSCSPSFWRRLLGILLRVSGGTGEGEIRGSSDPARGARSFVRRQLRCGGENVRGGTRVHGMARGFSFAPRAVRDQFEDSRVGGAALFPVARFFDRVLLEPLAQGQPADQEVSPRSPGTTPEFDPRSTGCAAISACVRRGSACWKIEHRFMLTTGVFKRKIVSRRGRSTCSRAPSSTLPSRTNWPT